MTALLLILAVALVLPLMVWAARGEERRSRSFAMDDLWLWILAGLLFGCLVGGPIAARLSQDAEWQADCEKVGYHRVGDKVYECKLKGASNGK